MPQSSLYLRQKALFRSAFGVLLVMNCAGQGDVANLPVSPRARTFATVTGKPFQSRFESTRSTESGATERLSGEMLRYSNGSVVIAHHSETEDLTTVENAARQELLFINHRSREVYVTKTGGTTASTPGGWAFANCKPAFTGDYRQMFGLAARRVSVSDVSDTAKSIGEIWLAEELGIVLLDTSFVNGVSRTWRVTELRLEQPNPAVLEPPSGYRVINMDDQ